ncbi:MAG: RidA family protein [Xanthobacteraceae bacterium]|nr:RidA family protein [Xanthobacteraceae bacterium]MCW5676950.1 RidA family protein [Xanthobacteraceae bacterium]
MTMIEQRLREAGFEVPAAQPSVANYVAALVQGDLLFISGQLPFEAGKVRYQGRVGDEVSIEDGKLSARLCALNALGQAKAALGDLDRIKGCVRIGGFVNSGADFHQQPAVVNGASDLIVAALGDAGRHTRSAVGCSALPMNAATEIEAIFSIK